MAAQASQPARTSPRRAVVFRVLAVLLGLSPFLVGEFACRWFDWGRPQSTADPYVGFAEIAPLFEQNGDGTRLEIPEYRLPFFTPESFDVEKSDDEFRVFCLGGSTVQGRPYSKETSFTRWLELSLKAADPEKKWRVINCGGVSYASYRLVPILEEVLRYQPDMVILYTGHNEFLEDRTYGHLKETPSALRHAYQWLRHSRLFSTLYQAWHGSATNDSSAGRPLLPKEVDALLDYRGGLESYRRDEQWREDVAEHFDWNLRRMSDLCRQHGVPLVLVDPVSNIKDCPPFKIDMDPSLDDEQRQHFERHWESARRKDLALEERAEHLRKCLAIDPRHAGASFLLARTLDALGDGEAALVHYRRAKDADVCPLRMLESMHDRLRDVAETDELPLVEARSRIASESPSGIIGDEWMLDHVHPSIRGHQLIAEMIMQLLIDRSYVSPVENWTEARDRLYRENLGSLDTAYFARGKEKLEGLKRWTEGRVDKLRAGVPTPQGQGPKDPLPRDDGSE